MRFARFAAGGSVVGGCVVLLALLLGAPEGARAQEQQPPPAPPMPEGAEGLPPGERAPGQQPTQQPVQETPGEQQQRPGGEEGLDLVFEREVFTYPGLERRDPFRPLLEGAEGGPRFEELELLGILYSRIPDRSMALLGAGEEEERVMYRVRQGQVLGNVRIIEIQESRLIVEVDEFGLLDQHVMELKTRSEGAT